LSFLFAALWYGNLTIVSIYMLQLLEAQPASAGTEAFWVGAAAMALAVTSIVAMPLWGRALDRFGPTRILLFATAAAAITHAPLLILQTPLQLVLARLAFGLTSAAMLPAIIQLVRLHAPAGKDARAISYASSFQCIGMGLVPFSAGLIGPATGALVAPLDVQQPGVDREASRSEQAAQSEREQHHGLAAVVTGPGGHQRWIRARVDDEKVSVAAEMRPEAMGRKT